MSSARNARDRPPVRPPAALLVVALACATVFATGASAAFGSVTTSARTEDRDAGEHALTTASDAWPLYGHDLANTRLNSAERQINRRSVSRLAPNWTVGGLIGVSGTPVVAGNVAYFDDWTGNVRAVDARIGRPVWTTKIGGFVVGAPAVRGDAVYAASGATLYDLDRRTGAIRWRVPVDADPLAQISASPVVVDGLVLQGVASAGDVIRQAKYTFRGSIAAYDAATGRLVWRFFTTPNDRTAGPGVGIWSTPAVDRDRGLLYVGTGNAFAEPNGALADALLAIDYHTGRLAWARQFTAPDIFSGMSGPGRDADVGASPNLWSVNDRDLVGVGDKAGVYHALDRRTGQVVWERQLTPGSALGGVIGSAAFSDGRLFVPSNVGNPATNFPTNITNVFALDAESGDTRWISSDLPGKMLGPVSAVPGVVFAGTDTGLMTALDARTGARRWTYEAPDKTACGPSIADGRVLWGYGFTLFGPAGKGGIISFTLPDAR